MTIFNVDFDYISTLRMEIVEGRDFSADIKTDSSAYIINEAAFRQLGWANISGQELSPFGIDNYSKVIGVVKDFHHESLHTDITPLVLSITGANNNPRKLMPVRIRAANIISAIASVESKWDKFLPGQPFEYSFLDEDFNTLYKSEMQAGNIIGTLTLLGIFIGSLGLFGLAAYSAERRTKEIGIRKVLGASITGIIPYAFPSWLSLQLKTTR